MVRCGRWHARSAAAARWNVGPLASAQHEASCRDPPFVTWANRTRRGLRRNMDGGLLRAEFMRLSAFGRVYPQAHGGRRADELMAQWWSCFGVLDFPCSAARDLPGVDFRSTSSGDSKATIRARRGESDDRYRAFIRERTRPLRPRTRALAGPARVPNLHLMSCRPHAWECGMPPAYRPQSLGTDRGLWPWVMARCRRRRCSPGKAVG
jgi:hypothetical protein